MDAIYHAERFVGCYPMVEVYRFPRASRVLTCPVCFFGYFHLDCNLFEFFIIVFPDPVNLAGLSFYRFFIRCKLINTFPDRWCRRVSGCMVAAGWKDGKPKECPRITLCPADKVRTARICAIQSSPLSYTDTEGMSVYSIACFSKFLHLLPAWKPKYHNGGGFVDGFQRRDAFVEQEAAQGLWNAYVRFHVEHLVPHCQQWGDHQGKLSPGYYSLFCTRSVVLKFSNVLET